MLCHARRAWPRARRAEARFAGGNFLEHLQLVTISRPDAYGEYAPYTIVKDREEFIRLVLQMKPCQADDDDVRKISEQLMEKNRIAYEMLAK